MQRSAIAAIVLLAVALLAIPATAAAQYRAVARSVVQTTTAIWGAVSTAPGAEAVAGRPAIVSKSRLSQMTEYFDVVNSGKTVIVGQSLDIDSKPGFWGPSNPSLTVVICPTGDWNQSNRCQGGEVSLGTNSRGDFTAAVTLLPGERYSARVSSAFYAGPFTSTINVAVSGSQLRAGTTTSN